MTGFIREWMLFRSMLTLAARKDFSRVQPEQVLRILQNVSNLHDSSYGEKLALGATSETNVPMSKRVQLALNRIWELSAIQSRLDEPNRFKWQRVMAICNSLYQQFKPLEDRIDQDEAL